MSSRRNPLDGEDNPLWYKDGVIYQLHVRAFFDSNNDGIGDFRGLMRKLDYLQDLGVTAIWLLPFYPSPLRDDGYDIASYSGINDSYGNIADFKAFLDEAHRRGLRVITELVINHTSDQHPWFQKARSSPPGSKWRDFYVWTDNPKKYKEARIIFKDFETSNWTWDPVAKAYYWHRFFHHQPDLNFDNPAVHKAVAEAMDFWMKMGVDGVRLDAIPYLYEREGTSCENLPETHAYLKSLRAHLDSKWDNRMLLAEANQWPEDSRPYFGDGDECHVAFHFPLMPRLFMSVAMEDRFPIIDIMAQTPDIPDNCQWALFLRNHDELTLEMVTDEDRDYMYRTYARDRQARINLGIRRRLAPLLENHRPRIELLNALLFSFPGTPIIYYGDEIGMGDNIYLGDRNGVRTPMQWSADRNAGFSRANPQRLYFPVIIDPEYHYEAVNVEAQQANTHSLLWWMKRLIDLRKRYIAFGRGTLEFLQPENRKVLAMLRSYEDQQILVVANLSRNTQVAELDLSAFRGAVPVELSGRTRFPVVGESPYMLTLGPYSIMWLLLTREAGERPELDLRRTEELISADTWEELVSGRAGEQLEGHLERYIRGKRWFGGKAREISGTELVELVPLDRDVQMAALRVSYVEGAPETYVLPLATAWGAAAKEQEESGADLVVARLKGRRSSGVVYEAVTREAFTKGILQLLRNRKRLRGLRGTIVSQRTKLQGDESIKLPASLHGYVARAEQSNTSILYGESLFVKLFRRIEPGINPDVEISRFLTEETEFRNTPLMYGSIEYTPDSGGEAVALAIAQQLLPNAQDAWRFTLDELGRYFERVLSSPEIRKEVEATIPKNSPLELVTGELPPIVLAALSTYITSAELIGRRTGELHVALASSTRTSDFAPEPFSPHYQRGVYQSMRTQTTRTLQLLRRRMKTLSEGVRADAEAVLAAEEQLHERFRPLVDQNIQAMRTRVHGDYHLGQLLYTGKDFFIIDFEGEPSRPLSERRLKRSPVRDVAGMMRSFHYATYAALLGQGESSLRPEDAPALSGAAEFWYRWVETIFLREYIFAATAGNFLPPSSEQLKILLEVYVLEKALYEVVYELNHRPEWVAIPLRGILQILRS
jgi:maltose alpha-D-glucosyltransferase/alpha-amylase